MAIGEDPHGKIKIDVDDQYRIARIEREIRQTSVRLVYTFGFRTREQSLSSQSRTGNDHGSEVSRRVGQVDGEREWRMWYSRLEIQEIQTGTEIEVEISNSGSDPQFEPESSSMKRKKMCRGPSLSFLDELVPVDTHPNVESIVVSTGHGHHLSHISCFVPSPQDEGRVITHLNPPSTRPPSCSPLDPLVP